jgi:hypothetical protein
VSYPLWQYANGALDTFSNIGDNWTQEQMINMIQLDPAKQSVVSPDDVYTGLSYRLMPSDQYDDMTKIFNFDFLMILGHNFASTGTKITLHGDSDEEEVDSLINTTNLVNYQQEGEIEFDGWSLANITGTGSYDAYNLRLGVAPVSDAYLEKPLRIGTIMWGNSYTFPHNANVNETLTIDYGVKQKQTIAGKTISTANWQKPDNWITEPWGLSVPYQDNFDNFARRSGRRTWNISFDSVAPEQVMNQLPMLNSNGWIKQDNHSAVGANNESRYNIYDSVDFFTNVIHKSMGGHLPIVMQIDKDDYSPQNFAIVRIDSDYKITQKTPNLYNISLKLVEQI